MSIFRTHTPAKNRNGAKVAALVAAAMLTGSLSACKTMENLSDGEKILVAAGAGILAAIVGKAAQTESVGSRGQGVAQGGGREGLNKELLEAAGTMLDIGRDEAHTAKRLNAVKRLIAAGANVNYVDVESCGINTPLGNAIATGSLEIVRVLLENGANPNAETKQFGDSCVLVGGLEDEDDSYETLTPLTLAAKEVVGSVFPTRMEILKLLIDKGSNINAFDGEGQTALMILAGNGGDMAGSRSDVDDVTVAATELLLDKGADFDVKNGRQGWTPLMLAASSAPAKVVQLLLDRGASVNATGKAKETALALAQKRKNKHTAELRQTKSGDVYAKMLRADINEADKIISMLKAAGGKLTPSKAKKSKDEKR